MIEVEKKVSIQDEDKLARLIKGAVFLREVTNEDVYFDNDVFGLTTKEMWLRTRNGKFELKIAMHEKKSAVDQYDELENDADIARELGLAQGEPLARSLEHAGYLPIMEIKTVRQKYKLDDFNIDIDSTDFGLSTYEVGEIELMVANSSEIPDALAKINAFLKARQLPQTHVRGKIIEFLHRHRPEHYRALVEAGVAGTS